VKRLKIFENIRIFCRPSQKDGTFASLQLAQMIEIAMGHKKAQKDIKKLATEGADTLGTSLHGFLGLGRSGKKV